MGGKILMVDDSTELLEAYREVLEAEGYEVQTATSGEDALALMAKQRPDLLITDIFMPGMGGLELITRARSDLAPPAVPIVAMSGLPNVREEALRRGALRFELKPIELDELLGVATDALRGNATPAQARTQTALEHRSVTRAAGGALLDAFFKREPDAIERSRAAVRLIARFYGHSKLVTMWSREGGVDIGESSDAALAAEEHVRGELLVVARHVIESGGSLVASDIDGIVSFPGLEHAKLRFMVAVPLRIGPICVGALCLLDHLPHAFSSSDLALLEYIADRSTAVVASPTAPRVIDSNGLVTRESFVKFLDHTLSWATESDCSIAVAVAHSEGRLARPAPGLELAPRAMFGRVGPQSAAMFIAAKSAEEVHAGLSRMRGELQAASPIVVWGQVVFERTVPPIHAEELLGWCSNLAARNAAANDGENLGLECKPVECDFAAFGK